MGIDAIVTLASLFGPKIIDLIRGILGKKNTPEQTLAELAITKPEALASYVSAQAQLVASQNAAVNADVSGQLSTWVSNLRALIRPALTVVSALHIVFSWATHNPISQEVMYVHETVIGSWFGGRLR